MKMDFDQDLYGREMREVLRSAASNASRLLDSERVYSVSIWTDPDAAASAISIDTRAHSAKHVATLAAFARSQVHKYDGTPHAELTEPLLNLPERNINPASFALTDLATTKHRSFPQHWATGSDGRCWELLGPALEQIAQDALRIFRDLPLETDAELGINSASEWYTHRRPLAFPVAPPASKLN